MGGGSPGRGSCLGCIAKLAAAKEPGVFAVVCKGGKKQVGSLCFCSLLSGVPGTSGASPVQEDWRQLGMGGEGCLVQHPSILHLFHGCFSLAQSSAGESRLTLEQWQGRRGGEETRGQRTSHLPSWSARSPVHMRGFKQGEWSSQFSDKAIYYPKAAGFSVCPMSPGRWECRQGKGKNWIQFRL